MRTILTMPLIIFLILLIVLVTKLISPDTKQKSTLIGKQLPSFTLPEIHTGLPGLSNTDLLGNYGLLNIFGSWCIACKIEHLFLMKLKENNIIPIYGIAWRDTSEKLNNYLKENGNPYNNIGSDSTGKTIIDLGITGAPETFLISPDGRVLFHYAGPITDEIWNKEILPLINRGI